VGQQTLGNVAGRGNQFRPGAGLRNLHQPIAAALFGSFDNAPSQAIQRLFDGLGHRARRHQRHHLRYPQFHSLLDQPLLPISLGQGNG
jgi:hypothetical protein